MNNPTNNQANSQPNKQASSFPGTDSTEKKAGYQPNTFNQADQKPADA
jgi:hypothetical protein